MCNLKWIRGTAPTRCHGAAACSVGCCCLVRITRKINGIRYLLAPQDQKVANVGRWWTTFRLSASLAGSSLRIGPFDRRKTISKMGDDRTFVELWSCKWLWLCASISIAVASSVGRSSWIIVDHVARAQTDSFDIFGQSVVFGPSVRVHLGRVASGTLAGNGSHCTAIILHQLLTYRDLVVDWPWLRSSMLSTISRIDLNFPCQQSSMMAPMGRWATWGN